MYCLHAGTDLNDVRYGFIMHCIFWAGDGCKTKIVMCTLPIKAVSYFPLFMVTELSVTVLLSDSGGGRKVSPCNDLCM